MISKILKKLIHNISVILPDYIFLKIKFRFLNGYKLNLKSPNTYSEKLQWLKLYDQKPKEMDYVDKFKVRDYIKNTIGEEYLIPLLGVYNNVEEINWDSLPTRFVLKCTHGSGCNIICSDKTKLNIKEAKKKLNKWMRRNWYWYGREWSYKELKPKIICETYLQHNIIDYKIMCFNGEPKVIQIHQNRFNEDHTIDFYDVNWVKTNISRKNTPSSNDVLQKPKNLDEMLNIAKRLSHDEIHVRIDLYDVEGKIYFGEKTYYSASGFAPFSKKEHDEQLGEYIMLPHEK